MSSTTTTTNIQLKSPNEGVMTTNMDSPPENSIRFRTYKNILIISFAFLLQFTAFGGIDKLQSSLNAEANVGVNSLSIIYVCLILSSIFLPHPLMSILGLKWTIVLSQIPYVLYSAANLYPKAYLMYPAAALVGLAAAPLWTSKCTYLTDTGTIYAQQKSINKDVVVNRFFGIFFMFFQSGQIWGNLISFLILKPQEKGVNATITPEMRKYNKCGADFSEQEYKNMEVINQVDRKTVHILCFVYIAVGICSILTIIAFLDQRRKDSKEEIPVMLRKSVTLLISTVKQMRHLNQLLLIPLTIYSGLEQSYLGAQFTKAFVSCVLNPKYVGLILIAYGVCDSLGSFGFGQLVKFIGRWPCFLLAAIINYSLILTMFFWKPSADKIFVLFIIASFWGLTDAIWQTQINAFYGVLFVENGEAAFSNYRLWESTGFVIFYIITPYIRIRLALILLIIFLTLGMFGYIIAEYRLRKKQVKNNQVGPAPMN